MNLIDLYLQERRQIESDYYIDSFINHDLPVKGDKDRKKNETTSMKKRYTDPIIIGDSNQPGEHEPYPDTMGPDKSKPFIELFSTHDDRFD